MFEEGISTNWLHLYIKNDVLPTTKKATELIQNFNQIGQGVQTHATLFTFLNWKVIKRLLLDWVSLLKAGKKIKGIYSLEIKNSPISNCYSHVTPLKSNHQDNNYHI